MAEITTDFIVGRPYQDGTGWRQPGDRLTPEDVQYYPALNSLVGAGFLYPYSPEQGYDRLPPHLFNYTQTLREAQDHIEAITAPLDPSWNEPDQLVASRNLIEAENESRKANNQAAQLRAEKFYSVINETSSGEVKVSPSRESVDAKRDDAARAGYESMGKDEIVEEIRARNSGRKPGDTISTSGTKPDLINRLVADDASS